MTYLSLFHPATVIHRVLNTMKRAKRQPSELPGMGGHAGLLQALFLPERTVT